MTASIRSQNTNVGTGSTSVVVNMPATVVAGDLLLCLTTVDAPSTTPVDTNSAGWVRIYHDTQGADVLRLTGFAKIATGVSGSDPLTITKINQDYVFLTMAIQGHGVSNVSTDIKLAAAATGASGNSDPPSLDAGSSKDWFWLAHGGIDCTASGDTLSDRPANYTTVSLLKSTNSATSCGNQVASRALTAQTENPGTFTNTSRPWIAKTLAIPPTAFFISGTVHAVANPTVSDVNAAAVAHYGAGSDIDDLLALFDPDGPRTSDAFCQAWWGKNAADCYREILLTDRFIQLVRQASIHQVPSTTNPTHYLKYLGGDVLDTFIMATGDDAGARYWLGSDYPLSGSTDAVDLTTNLFKNISTLPQRNHLLKEFEAGMVDAFGVTRVADALGAGFQNESGPNTDVWVAPSGFGTGRIYWPICALSNSDSGVSFYVGAWLTDPAGGGELNHALEDSHILAMNVFGTVGSVAVFGSGIGSSLGYVCDFIEESTYTYVFFREYVPIYGPGTPNHFEDLTTDTTYTKIARIDTSGALTVMDTQHTGTTFTNYQFWDGSGWSSNSANAVRLKTAGAVDIAGDGAVARLAANDYIMCAQRYWETSRRVYKATAPQGPWTLIATVPTPAITQEVVTDIWRTCIHMKVHPDFPASAGHVMSMSQTMAFVHAGSPSNPVFGRHIHAQDISYFIEVPTASTELVVADTSHGHTTDAVALTQVHNLVVADTAHAHTTDAVALTQVHDLVVADTAHAHTTDAVALTQVHDLVVADTAHAHTTDAVALTQVHELVVVDSSHGHTTENVTLDAGAPTLVVADTSHGHISDAVALTQVHVLVVADSSHAHSSEGVALTQVHVLVVADTAHAHTTDALALTQGHVLAGLADTSHGHTAENVTLTQAHNLTVADTSHAHTTENVTLSGAGTLAVADTSHAHTTENVVLTQVHVLIVSDSAHAHTTENVVLTTPGGTDFNMEVVALAPVFFRGEAALAVIDVRAVVHAIYERTAEAEIDERAVDNELYPRSAGNAAFSPQGQPSVPELDDRLTEAVFFGREAGDASL